MKKKLIKYYFLFKYVVIRPFLFYTSVRGMFGKEVNRSEQHINEAVEWLLKSQVEGIDQGYSRGFYFSKGWDKSYIETSGYIIPTLMNVGIKFKRQDCIDSALRAGRWLLSQQLDDGSFPDVDKGISLAFDTGQVLYGLNCLATSSYVDHEEKAKYLASIERAAEWLATSLDTDGSWTTVGFNILPHTYYTRVAYALAHSGKILNRDDLLDKARLNIDWAISCQQDNGFYQYLEMSKSVEPYLHPIAYVLEGLLEYYELTGYTPALDSVLKNAEQFKEINLNRDIILGSQYNSDFVCVNTERCITGLAQWAGICLKLFKITNSSEYLVCAQRTLYYLKAKQLKEGKNIKGSFPGSIPIWGEYSPYSYNNWPVKFFIDAMLEYHYYERNYKLESLDWINACFSFSKSKVISDFSSVSEQIYQFLESTLKHEDKILDLGCGEGKYVRRLNNVGFNVLGIDPCFHTRDTIVSKGDCYSIPYASGYFDCIYTSETMQHVKYLTPAFQEIYRCLSDQGECIIIDRDLNSIAGRLLKPLKELLGQWMYPYDSPMREMWYTYGEWDSFLEKMGFEVLEYKSIKNTGSEKYAWFSKYHIIRVKKI